MSQVKKNIQVFEKLCKTYSELLSHVLCNNFYGCASNGITRPTVHGFLSINPLEWQRFLELHLIRQDSFKVPSTSKFRFRDHREVNDSDALSCYSLLQTIHWSLRFNHGLHGVPYPKHPWRQQCPDARLLWLLVGIYKSLDLTLVSDGQSTHGDVKYVFDTP